MSRCEKFLETSSEEVACPSLRIHTPRCSWPDQSLQFSVPYSRLLGCSYRLGLDVKHPVRTGIAGQGEGIQEEYVMAYSTCFQDKRQQIVEAFIL